MSFAKPTGSRLLFFTALPFVLLGIAAFTFPLPGEPGALPLSGVLILDGVLALFLGILWPYHRLRLGGRPLAGMAAVFLSVFLAWLVCTGVSELPSPIAFRKLLLGPVVVGSPAYLCGYFAVRGSPPRVLAQWWPQNAAGKQARALFAAQEQARATWTRFLELRTSARAALVQVRLRGSEGDEQGTPILLSNDQHANPIEFRRAIKVMTIWGEVLEAGPETVRVQLRSRDRSLVVGTCEAHLRRVCDWELLMRDGTIEGGYGLRALGALASQRGIRLPRRVRRRLRRCRSLPEPASGCPRTAGFRAAGAAPGQEP